MTLTKLEKFVQKYKVKRALYGRSLFAASECFKGLTYLLTTKAKNMCQNCLRQGSVLINVTSNLPRCLGLGTLTVHLLLFWFSGVYCFNQQHFKRAGIKELEITNSFSMFTFLPLCNFLSHDWSYEMSWVLTKQHQKSGLSILPIDISFLARNCKAAVGVTGGRWKDWVIQKLRLHGHHGRLLHKSVDNLKVNSMSSLKSPIAPCYFQWNCFGWVIGRTFPT